MKSGGILLLLISILFSFNNASDAGNMPFKDCTGKYPQEQEELFCFLYINDKACKLPYITLENVENKKEIIYYFPAEDFLKALGMTGTYDREKDKLIINDRECPKEYGIIGIDIKSDKKILYLSFLDILKFLKLPVSAKENSYGVTVYTRTDYLKTGQSKSSTDPNSINVAINAMIELDFKTKTEIYSIRNKYVAEHPEILLKLTDKPYNPSEAIFGQIVSEKPWWGILGIYYYGNGNMSIEGPSEESRFIANPYLLVALCECNAYNTGKAPSGGEPSYPKPTTLLWNPSSLWMQVVYNVSDYFRSYCNKPDTRKLNLVAYNARDFGFNYLYVVPDQSTNVTSLNKTGQAAQISQFIHLGSSCGYPGGGNNMSPYQEELIIQVGEVPARTYINLWRNKPANVKQRADLTVVIDIF
jgi:hypothetical protein